MAFSFLVIVALPAPATERRRSNVPESIGVQPDALGIARRPVPGFHNAASYNRRYRQRRYSGIAPNNPRGQHGKLPQSPAVAILLPRHAEGVQAAEDAKQGLRHFGLFADDV